MAKTQPIYGLLAEFAAAETLVEAARKTTAAGYRRAEAYSPFPVHGIEEALGFGGSRVAMLVLIGAILGAGGGFLMMCWSAMVSYPLNVGGRPLNSWPAFIPIAFELGILGAGGAAVLGMLALNGLPRPYHPLFNVPAFSLASRDRFFLCIESRDPKFNLESTRKFLESLGPVSVHEAPM